MPVGVSSFVGFKGRSSLSEANICKFPKSRPLQRGKMPRNYQTAGQWSLGSSIDLPPQVWTLPHFLQDHSEPPPGPSWMHMWKEISHQRCGHLSWSSSSSSWAKGQSSSLSFCSQSGILHSVIKSCTTLRWLWTLSVLCLAINTVHRERKTVSAWVSNVLFCNLANAKVTNSLEHLSRVVLPVDCATALITCAAHMCSTVNICISFQVFLLEQISNALSK